MADLLDIEVIYAEPDSVWHKKLNVPLGTTIAACLDLAEFFAEFPNLSTEAIEVGIWAKRGKLTDIVNAGDHIEIYRPLSIDPMEARRIRASKR